MSLSQLYEQNHPHIVIPVLTDHNTVLNFFKLLHLTINFGRSDSYASGVQGGIGSAINNNTPFFINDDVISMTPDIGINIEISALIFTTVRIIPEINRHGWKRFFAYELPLLVDNVFTLIIKSLPLHGQAAALEFPCIYRIHRIPERQ